MSVSIPVTAPVGPVDDPRDRIFLERLEDGMYDSVNKQIMERPTSLALLQYIGTKKRPATVYRGIDWAGNLVFNDGPGKNANEIRATMFGEIAEPVHGTMVSARGNHYEGNTSATFKPIDDKTKVKDVLVLRAPTLCGVTTSGLWHNQRALLQDIISTEKNQDEAFGWHPFYNTPFRSSTTDNPREDMIAIYTQKKYGVPTSAGAPGSAGATPPSTPQKAVRAKRAFVSDGATDSDDEREPAGSSGGVNDAAAAGLEVPGPEKIFLGAFYDPRLLEDFGGPSFKLVKARLRQLDHRGADNTLIPPWNHYSAFRPGSLIVATVSIHIYTFKAEGTDRDKDRKIFQIEAHTIRVLDESDFPVEKRLIHVPRHMVDQPSSSTGGNTNTSSVADSLTNFVFTPRKKRVMSATDHDEEMDGGAGAGGGEGSGGDGGSPPKRRKSNKK
ncbi:hypothetical protein R3P38DRAFT_3456331 [Favolaschia claudopus]|uniref:Uncharacterized protein n=1 Tax=Favolaschia claudopus TaxID=2862362 RepID=A0AAV9ZIY4_9AGAR